MEKKIFTRGDPVVAEFTSLSKSGEKIKRLYDFGYYNDKWCIVYKKGERNMQDSLAFGVDKVKDATKEDLENYYWG